MGIDLKNIRQKKVMLKVDLGCPCRQGLTLQDTLKTIQGLLDQGCGVCIVPGFGASFLRPGLSSQSFLSFFKEGVSTDVQWLSCFTEKDIALGSVFLTENVFLDHRELICDAGYIQLIKDVFDVVVFDSIVNFDGNFATTRGVMKSGMPYAWGYHVLALIALRDTMQSSKVGLVLGGGDVAAQLILIQSFIGNLRFLAVSGEIGLIMMGKGGTIYGYIKDQLLLTMALLRHHKVKIIYPLDVIAYSFAQQRNRMVLYQDLEKTEKVCDLGHRSIDRLIKHIAESDVEVIVVNESLGYCLDPRYSRGSEVLIQAVSKQNKVKVVMGKQVVQLVNRMNLVDSFDYVLDAQIVKTRFLSQNDSMDVFIKRLVGEHE